MKRCLLSLLALVLLVSLSPVVAFASQAGDNISSQRITEATDFLFIPPVTGYWTFETSDNAGSDPMLWLRNAYGFLLGVDDDSAGNLNASLTVHLVEGAEYILTAGYWRGSHGGEYTLSFWRSDTFVRPQFDGVDVSWNWEPIIIPAAGGSAEASGEAEFLFTPAETGFWSVRIYSEYAAEMFIVVNDPMQNSIAYSPNLWQWGEEFEDIDDYVEVVVHLVAGTQYSIDAFSWWGFDEFTFSVTPTAEPVAWVAELFEHEGAEVDLTAARETISAGGDVINVDGETLFTFIPNETGPWTFETSENDGDPFIMVMDAAMTFVAVDDDSAGNLNARLSLYLAEGVEYIVWARFFMEGADGSYILDVRPFEAAAAPQQNIAQPASGQITVPEGGGRVELGQDFFSELTFTPAVTGSWTIQSGGPDSALWITDPSGTFDVEAEGFGYPAFITMALAAGVEYSIFAIDGTSSFLYVTCSHEIDLTGEKTIAQRAVAGETEFTIVVGETDNWLIYTSNNGQSDPMLWLTGPSGSLIATDDDSGEGLNALIKTRLTAGTVYTLRAGFFEDGGGRYTLTIRRAGQSTAELPRLIIENQ